MRDEPVEPHDLDAERAVLGALLVNETAWATAASMLRPEDFYRAAHTAIYAALLRLAHAGTALDFVTLCDELAKAGELDRAGSRAYVAALSDGVPRSANVASYAGIVREKAALRRVAREGEAITREALAADRPAASVASDGLKRLTAATAPVSGAGAVLARDAVQAYASALMGGTLGDPIPFGHADLDRLVGGIKPQSLVIVAGRPSSGKTSFSLGLADTAAKAGSTVCFFSLEMGQRQVAASLLARWARVSSDRVERASASEEEYARVSETLISLDDRPLYLETASRTPTEVWGWCRRLREERGLALAIVDYLQLLATERRRESRQAEIEAISQALKQIALDVGIAVCALSQLSRPSEKRRDKRPHLDELRGSGALEQDADLALLLHRQAQHDPSPEAASVAEVIVAKNRQGPTGVVKLAFLRELAKFEDLACDD